MLPIGLFLMDNYNPMQSMINAGANQYYSGYMPQLPPESYATPMNPAAYPPNDLMPMPPSGYVEQEPKATLPPPAQPPPMSAPLPPQYPVPQAPAFSEQMKPKQKRRSKNERSGRDYICGCGKTYLSYPALYTHIKTKHGGQNPCGTQQLQTGRGRGRPRKVRTSHRILCSLLRRSEVRSCVPKAATSRKAT
jgi:hypothetical protein